MQSFLKSLPEVGGATSIVGYVKQLNRAMSGNEASACVPNDNDLIAQLMLTYQASAPPTEFQSLVDRRVARRWFAPICARIAGANNDAWSRRHSPISIASSRSGFKATLTGRVMLDYEWVQSVASGHALERLRLDTHRTADVHRDLPLHSRWSAMSRAVVRLGCGVYAVMGIAASGSASQRRCLPQSRSVSVSTSRSHGCSRAQGSARGGSVDEQILYVYRSTGRSVLFNATAVGLGFGIVTLSAAPPIRMFGVLVATAIIGAFLRHSLSCRRC